MRMGTEFATAERGSPEDVQRQHEKLTALPFVQALLDAAPNMTVVLNAHRQIVYANRSFAASFGVSTAEQLMGSGHGDARGDALRDDPAFLGRRPGEAAGCIRSTLTEGGCGTSVFCQTCGAAIAIVNSQRTRARDMQECRMITGEEGISETAMDLRVWAVPIEVQGETFTVFSLLDICAEKRRETLERIFFHDVLNTAGGVKGLADMMAQGAVPETGIKQLAAMLSNSAGQLVGEISAQRMLTAAESGDLQVSAHETHTVDMLTSVLHQFHSDSVSSSASIVLDGSSQAVAFVTDPVLLRRVLTNLVKNALEADGPGGTVTLGAHADGDAVCFTVHNATVMAMPVQRQLFMRSFTTKGTGRGLGTYSIKLISERYLRGRVSFTSDEDAGTTFTVRYPKAI